jgi:hypothetical protein
VAAAIGDAVVVVVATVVAAVRAAAVHRVDFPAAVVAAADAGIDPAR